MEDDIKIIKSRNFAKRIIKLYQYLNDKDIEDIRKQVLRSGYINWSKYCRVGVLREQNRF